MFSHTELPILIRKSMDFLGHEILLQLQLLQLFGTQNHTLRTAISVCVR